MNKKVLCINYDTEQPVIKINCSTENDPNKKLF